ncbi:MAG: hypothetical protein JRI23_16040 [Deltaproteobacteria bacterium]|jgi:hypothetical protein|nr:hypothetical protein [Deltaproteobacteria bacterium]MBW2533275.1 hypothetical protein [Deltaproteobacteria bacterium]
MDNRPMYTLFVHSGTLELWQQNYCKGDYQPCARLDLERKGKPVPVNLMPSGAILERETL